MILADVDPFVQLVEHNGPFAALLLIILWGGFKKEPWWVFGWVYRDLLGRYNRRGDQLDKWWETARNATITAQTLAQAKLPDGESDKDPPKHDDVETRGTR